MRSDAQEAALGLLGLTGSLDFSRTTPATSSVASTSTIPLKRKTVTSASASATLPRLPSQSQPRSLAILLNNDELNRGEASTNSETIDCVCGFTYDDGFSVACDKCGTWVHAVCFDIAHGNVPEIFKCWKCDPRGGIDRLREKAVRLQRAQQHDLDVGVGDRTTAEVERNGNGPGGRKRVSSPGIDRKRRASTTAVEGGQTKRRRRLSMGAGSQHPPQVHPHQSQPVSAEEEHVEIDEPATHSYVHTDKDLVPHQHTRDRLKLLAQHWRGVTALEYDEDAIRTPTSTALTTTPVYLTPDELPKSPQTSLLPLPRSSYSHPSWSSNINVNVRPPSYTVRTTQPISSEAFIAPYTSTIVPSTVYLSDPLNSYAHLGMPKPFVHLMGAPFDVALDARLTGNSSRFVRSGCKPNAVLRPVLCQRPTSAGPSAEETLTFGVFALRDLKAHEEVVLGWEWDDGSVIHHLPALIDSPHLFSPSRFEQYRHQMTSMLHTLSSTFTTCACGSSAKDCALNRLADFVDGQTPPTPSPSPPSSHDDSRMDDILPPPSRKARMHTSLGPLIGVQRGFKTRERVPMSGGMSGVEMDIDHMSPPSSALSLRQPEAGPSNRPFPNGIERTTSGSSSTTDGSNHEGGRKSDRKGKGRAAEEDAEMDVEMSPMVSKSNGRRQAEGSAKKTQQSSAAKLTSSAGSTTRSSPRSDSTVDPDPPPVPVRVGEARLPPKLRKEWIHRNSEVLKETMQPNDPSTLTLRVEKAYPSGSREYMDVADANHDAKVMPPPPLPPSMSSLRPPINNFPVHALRPADLASPTTSFANLSLLSPANGPAPHFPGAFGRSISICTSPSPSAHSTAVLGENVDSLKLSQSNAPEKSILGSPFVRREVPVSDPVTLSSVSLQPAQSTTDIEKPDTVLNLTSSCKTVEPDELLKAEKSPVTEDEVALHQEIPEAARLDTPVADLSETNDNDMVIDSPSPHAEQSGGSNDIQNAEPRPIPSLHCGRPAEAPPAPPSPAPPTKVKLSLKDFAMRKKKKREEEQAAASPVVLTVQLGVDPPTAVSEINIARIDESPQRLAQPRISRSSSPVLQVQTFLKSPTTSTATSLKSTGDAATVDHDPALMPITNGSKARNEDVPRSVEQSRPLTASHGDAVMTERNSAQETGANNVAADQHGPDQIPSEVTTEVAGACFVAHSSRAEDTALSRARSPAPQLAHRLDRLQQTPIPESARHLEKPVSVSESKPPRRPENLTPSSEYAKKENYEPLPLPERPPMGPPPIHQPLARQISQEDGEIFSPPPPKPLPLAPRSHTPPTHPRSFHHSGNTSPVRGPPASALRRPLQPSSYRSQLPSAPSSRPLPSGPRALRGVGNSGPPPLPLSYSSSSSSPYPSFPSGRSDGPHMAPRGPSADRERDRDRIDWDRDRGRAGSWSRSRGSGWSR